MTDDLESNSSDGSAGSPNSAASIGSNVSSTSTPEAPNALEQMESLVSKAVEKALQSQKDKRFSTIEKKLDGFTPVMEQVKAILTPEQLKKLNAIQKDAEFEELKQAVYGKTDSSTPTEGNQTSAAKFDAQNILKEYQLDGNDPDVIAQVLSKDFKNETEAKLAAANLAFRRSNPTPPDISAAPVIKGGAPVTKISAEQADVKYADLSKLLRDPTMNAAKIKNLTKELKDSGYEV